MWTRCLLPYDPASQPFWLTVQVIEVWDSNLLQKKKKETKPNNWREKLISCSAIEGASFFPVSQLRSPEPGAPIAQTSLLTCPECPSYGRLCSLRAQQDWRGLQKCPVPCWALCAAPQTVVLCGEEGFWLRNVEFVSFPPVCKVCSFQETAPGFCRVWWFTSALRGASAEQEVRIHITLPKHPADWSCI